MSRSRDIADSTKTLDVDGGTIKLDGNYPVGSGNVALGDTALDSTDAASIRNTALGHYALTANSTGNENTGVGSATLIANSTGSANSAFGRIALAANTTGGNNTAFGHSALLSNTTASNNTAVGYQAGYSNTTGTINSAFGLQALYNNTTANNNSAFGALSLYSNTTGSENTAVGREALRANTTGYENTFIGYQSGDAITTGVQNTGVGYNAGGAATTGASNTYLGHGSGSAITTGNQNTILGRYSGNNGGLDIRTGSNNIVLSDGSGNPRMHIDPGGNITAGGSPSATVPGFQVQTGGGNFYYLITAVSDAQLRYHHQFINNNGTVGTIHTAGSSTSYNTSSDHRLKENVVYDWDATTRLKQLKPARFNFIVDADTTVDGFLAHEAQAVVPEAVHGTHNEVDDDGAAVMQGIDQSKLVPLLVKTIQELEARITALEGA